MSIEMSAGVLVADLIEGMQFTLGPTMAVRRSCVREIGGFGMLGAYCADDFVLGHAIAAKRPHDRAFDPRDRSCGAEYVTLPIRRNTRFGGCDPRVSRGPEATSGPASRSACRLGCCLRLRPARSAIRSWLLPCWPTAFLRVRRLLRWWAPLWSTISHLFRTALLYPLRDLLGFFYWAASYGNSEIVWRNQIYRLTRGGFMVQPEDTLEREPVLDGLNRHCFFAAICRLLAESPLEVPT